MKHVIPNLRGVCSRIPNQIFQHSSDKPGLRLLLVTGKHKNASGAILLQCDS